LPQAQHKATPPTRKTLAEIVEQKRKKDEIDFNNTDNLPFNNLWLI
jgi:hypothetical protein